MVLVPGGSFSMGSDEFINPLAIGDDYYDTFHYETPAHTVWLPAFYIDVFPVTNELYQQFLLKTGQPDSRSELAPHFLGPRHPVVGVSWHEANAYAKWAGKTLPTEAQWEKAARGGKDKQVYPWNQELSSKSNSNSADQQCPLPWRETSVDDGYPYTSPVGSFPANDLGIYDMAGNVWEWCFDDCRDYEPGCYESPMAPLTFDRRAVRGGAWSSPLMDQRCSRRDQRIMSASGSALNNVGFRCVIPSPGSSRP